MSELRWHPLLEQWVVVTAHRQERPQMPAAGARFVPVPGACRRLTMSIFIPTIFRHSGLAIGRSRCLATYVYSPSTIVSPRS